MAARLILIAIITSFVWVLIGIALTVGVDIEKWQTLIAGLLALVAAAIGGRYINNQIRQTERLENERRARQQTAYRAVLPLVLSYLHEYSDVCGQRLRGIFDKCDGEQATAGIDDVEFPDLPSDVVPTFQKLIELSERSIGDHFKGVLARLQLQRSHIRSLSSERRPSHITLKINVEEYILDTAAIHAACSNTYEYGRFEAEVIPNIEWPHLCSALRLMGYYGQVYDTIFATIERRQTNGKQP